MQQIDYFLYVVSLNTEATVDVPLDTGIPSDKISVLGEAIKETLRKWWCIMVIMSVMMMTQDTFSRVIHNVQRVIWVSLDQGR
jgi:hypothetical protein